MSKTTLDSDLYGDIYGDEDNDFGFIEPALEENVTQTSADTSIKIEPKTEEKSSEPTQNPLTSTSKTETHSSLPPKPSVNSPQNGNSSLSYSAQIAQQFSAYQQTPSQERQQRQHALSAPLKTSPIATIDSTTGDSDTVFGKKPSEMHDAGNYFSQFGKVDACTIMRDPSGTSRGFAFLTFEDPNAVTTVTARDHFLDGKAIDPKRAIPREEHLRNTRYFVGGLAPSTTSESMKEFFAAYGKVVDATVMLDRESGRSKGFGFVTFEDANNADQLVGKNITLDDKQIEVKMAQPRSQRDQNRNNTNSFNSPLINSMNNRPESFESRMSQTNIPFVPQQPNPMPNVMLQRTMGQIPMMGSGMPIMNVNPMAMMGMNMQNFNPMANMLGGGMGGGGNAGGMGGMGGMNMMGGALNGMGGVGAMNVMNPMGNPGAMRLGMGPMGATGGVNQSAMLGGSSGMSGMMQMRQGVNNLGGGMVMPFGRMATNTTGLGPMRMHNRGQHNFHPYAR
ncbi:hnRNP A1-gamma isoform [Lentinula boryana]|uniref:HnRNP A1-gamma isoform n=1 Tax=Lentinula boryana TaxID=40481 RepID=A0ABQ8Q5G6_9AGAR|nr:hnRNP A1-gamma isoform [Lentinula boryana]